MIEIKNDNICEVLFTNCTFSGGRGSKDTYGVFLHTKKAKRNMVKAILTQCRFVNNHIGGLRIAHIRHIEVNNNWICNNTGSGIAITKGSITEEQNRTITIISNTYFHNNSQGFYLNLTVSQSAQIIGCNFTHHSSSSVMHIVGNHDYDSFTSGDQDNEVYIQGLNFERNYNAYHNCSALLLQNLNNIILEDLSFHKNNCTGIALVSSNIKVQKSLNLTWNRAISGGGLRLESFPVTPLKFSRMVLDRNTQINIIGNKANKYGGGIFTDQTCNDSPGSPECFFQFNGAIPHSSVFNFTGNLAELGGNAIFGGCLSNCLIDNSKRVDVTDPQNFIHVLVSLEKSSSTVAEYLTKVVFCSSGTSHCNTSHTLKAYRGEQFNVSLMAVDDSCTPSVDYMVKKAGGAEKCLKTKKYCDSYPYSIKKQLQ